jgi:hypothetical protein
MLWSEKNPVLSLVPGCKVTVIADEAKQWSDKVQVIIIIFFFLFVCLFVYLFVCL